MRPFGGGHVERLDCVVGRRVTPSGSSASQPGARLGEASLCRWRKIRRFGSIWPSCYAAGATALMTTSPASTAAGIDAQHMKQAIRGLSPIPPEPSLITAPRPSRAGRRETQSSQHQARAETAAEDLVGSGRRIGPRAGRDPARGSRRQPLPPTAAEGELTRSPAADGWDRKHSVWVFWSVSSGLGAAADTRPLVARNRPDLTVAPRWQRGCWWKKVNIPTTVGSPAFTQDIEPSGWLTSICMGSVALHGTPRTDFFHALARQRKSCPSPCGIS